MQNPLNIGSKNSSHAKPSRIAPSEVPLPASAEYSKSYTVSLLPLHPCTLRSSRLAARRLARRRMPYFTSILKTASEPRVPFVCFVFEMVWSTSRPALSFVMTLRSLREWLPALSWTGQSTGMSIEAHDHVGKPGTRRRRAPRAAFCSHNKPA